jgi:hypothetical protein
MSIGRRRQQKRALGSAIAVQQKSDGSTGSKPRS